ncbi:MAG: transglutaminase family protein [Alphaproteobacteria bacterium]|nr:transglutaminase family protein [Alphaproteobacteria bacterium]
MRLTIRHETVYQYERPVAFGGWRLLMRPVDSHALRILDASLEFTPSGVTRWSQDALGNSVCAFQPQGESDILRVVSNLLIERFPTPLEAAGRFDPNLAFPIVYSLDERLILDPFMRPATDGDSPAYRDWLSRWSTANYTLSVPFLQDLNTAIHRDFTYGERQEEGTQSPSETVGRGAGTCRDFAWLMVESLRRLGFATRFVTGYLYAPGLNTRGAGATHAWCEVFLPSLGWIEFDPTNGLAESVDLIRVAVSRTPDEASPMTGSIMGHATAQLIVSVSVTPVVTVGENLDAI